MTRDDIKMGQWALMAATQGLSVLAFHDMTHDWFQALFLGFFVGIGVSAGYRALQAREANLDRLDRHEAKMTEQNERKAAKIAART